MRRPEPLEPEVAAALEAIDATLEGEPVDPELAELAELALILRDERTEADAAFTRRLDDRVAARFKHPRAGTRFARRRLVPGGAIAAVAAAAIALAIVLPHGGSAGRDVNQAVGASSSSTTATSSSAASGASASSAGAAARAPAVPTGPAPAPRSAPHRQVVQSARLTLTAGAGRIDRVAQEVFDVVGAEHGIVSSSDVQARSRAASSAQFSLQVSSGHLQDTLNRLSRLGGARVTSRHDATADITGEVGAAGRRLAQARALQRSLLRQLAAALTTTAVDSLKTQLRTNGAAIVRDQAALAGLHRKVSLSSVSVSITAPAPGAARRRLRSGGAFTLSSALHSAGRVLVVAAGVALIALAVLVPLGLVAALLLWVWTIARHRRRESALGP